MTNARWYNYVCESQSLKVDVRTFVQPPIKAGLKFLLLCRLSLKSWHTKHFNTATYSWSTLMYDNHLAMLNTLSFSLNPFLNYPYCNITGFCRRANIAYSINYSHLFRHFVWTKLMYYCANAWQNWPEIAQLLDIIKSNELQLKESDRAQQNGTHY